MNKIELFHGDITEMEVDAIVNAANSSLLGGGGVDGAIHRVAGIQLLEECKTLNGCDTGDAKITKGYNLPAKYVIHTVGPVWYGGIKNEDQQLASCYKKCLELAVKHSIKTIAFPSISTGVYRFPKTRAADIAFREVTTFLKKHKTIAKVYFVTFDFENQQIYNQRLGLIK